MPKDPIGLFGRMNAGSLMLITPEFFKIRKLRTAGGGKIDHKPAKFSMNLQHMQLEGLKIRYAKAGNPNGPTVLFLSPLPQSILCYDKIWASLETEANLVALDLPGFGGSEGDFSHMTFEAQSAFLEKFINQLGLTDVHIVAPDVALPVSLHYVTHRAHKAASILIGDGPGVLPSADGSVVRKIVNYGFWRMVVAFSGASTFIATTLQLGYLHYSPSADEIRDYLSAYKGRIRQVCAWFKHYPEGLKALDPKIDTLDLPVQVFWGDEDAFLGAENAHLLHKRLPQSAITVFENCGHFSYQDKGAEFTKMLQDWIAGGYRQTK